MSSSSRPGPSPRVSSIIVLAALFLSPVPAHAATFYVSLAGQDIPPFDSWATASIDIQSAIDASKDGDTILIAAGTYEGSGNRDLDFGARAITVRSLSGPSVTIVDCAATLSDPHRGFWFHSGEDTNSTLEGLQIRNGFAPRDDTANMSYGGAIKCDSGSSPLIRGCLFRANMAERAGAAVACLRSSTPIIDSCVFDSNHVRDRYLSIAGFGGGMWSGGSGPWIRFCRFANNLAHIGGAVSCFESDVRIDSTIVTHNTATHLTVVEPVAEGVGGAIHSYVSSLTVTNSTFLGNQALRQWGLGGRPGRGGAIALFHSNAEFQNCSFHENLAEDYDTQSGKGGTTYFYNSSITLTACLVTNTLQGEVAYCVDTASTVAYTCSNLWDNALGDWTGCISSQAGLDGNISADPEYCNALSDSLFVSDKSPCLPINNSCNTLIGAWPEDCVGTGIVVDDSSSLRRNQPLTLDVYPNPANGPVSFEVTLAESAPVEISVVDVLGRMTARVFDGYLIKGRHIIRWDAEARYEISMASGVHFCVLQSGQYRSVRKITIVK